MTKNNILFVALIFIGALSMIGNVSAAVFSDYTYEATDTTLRFTFNDSMKDYTFYYEEEKILYTVDKDLLLNDLKPDNDYSIVAYNETSKEIQIIEGSTIAQSGDLFYMQYGLIGLLCLIGVCLFLSTKINYIALIAILLSFVGFGYSVSNEYGFITCFIFVILMLISILTYAKGDY